MSAGQVKIEYVSDITFSPVAKAIGQKIGLQVELIQCDISQHIQRLSITDDENRPDVLILHCSSEYYVRYLECSEAKNNEIELLSALQKFLKGKSAPWVIINTVEPTAESPIGIERAKILYKYYSLNQRLVTLAVEEKRLRLVDLASELTNIGLENCLSQKNNLVMKLPYRPVAIDAIAVAYASVIEDIYLPRKKVMVLDADNTLWGGVIGEDGLEGIRIEPANYPGVAYWRFQEKLKTLKDSGIVLAMVSKNNDSDVVEAFESIDMPLSLDDFTIRRVNWIDKASNISEIAEVLNLGVDSFVFVDDNEFEIEQVRHALPMVECHRFPANQPEDGLKIYKKIAQIQTWKITEEDSAKAQLYAQEVRRQEAKSASLSLENYLKSLEIRLEYGVNRKRQISRITQLINKTNQFNLTTRRYTDNEVEEIMDIDKVYDFKVVDRYGDMGIVGVVVVRQSDIDVFLMSCRALGREVESTMLKVVCDTNKGIDLTSKYIQSKKNQMVDSFYEENGFSVVSESTGQKFYKLGDGPKPKFQINIQEVN